MPVIFIHLQQRIGDIRFEIGYETAGERFQNIPNSFVGNGKVSI